MKLGSLNYYLRSCFVAKFEGIVSLHFPKNTLQIAGPLGVNIFVAVCVWMSWDSYVQKFQYTRVDLGKHVTAFFL